MASSQSPVKKNLKGKATGEDSRECKKYEEEKKPNPRGKSGGQLRTIKIEEEKLTLSNTPKAELSSIKRNYRRKNLT